MSPTQTVSHVSAIALAASCIFGLINPATATTVAIANNSFESPPTFSVGFVITNWIGCCVFRPTPTVDYAVDGSNGLAVGFLVPDGQQAALLGGSSAIEQLLSDALQVGTYTLTFYVGHPLGVGFSNARAIFGVVDAGGNGANELSVPIADPGAGKWALVTLTDVVTSGDPNLGNQLGILFSQSAAGFTNLDLVQLDFQAPTASTPLPATLPLFAGGLAALGLFGRSRRKKEFQIDRDICV